MDEELKPVETLTPYEAGKVLHANAETIRAGLRQGVFNFGSAIPPEKPGGNWNYIIIKSKFLKYADVIKEGLNIEIEVIKKILELINDIGSDTNDKFN